MLLTYFQIFTVIAIVPIMMMMIFCSNSHEPFWKLYKSCGMGLLATIGVGAVITWVLFSIMMLLGGF